MASPYTEYQSHNLGETFDGKLYEARRAIEKLGVKENALPKVEADGQSECSFAEQCYAQKEEIVGELRRLIAVFRSYVPAIDAEVARIERDYMLTGAARDRLHGAEPRRKLTESERKIREWRDGVIEQGRKATDMIKAMENAIAEADKKKWPLGQPKKSPYGHTGAQRDGLDRGAMLDSEQNSNITVSPPDLGWDIEDISQQDDGIGDKQTRYPLACELPGLPYEAETNLPPVPSLRTELDALLGQGGAFSGNDSEGG